MKARQDHEEVVAAARNDMKHFDQRQALERWIQNYVSPTTICVPGQWCVVTKDAKGWKVEHGLAEATEPYLTHYADAHAPPPPVMEIRPPKPEPVKLRERSPEPLPVASWDRIMADAQRQIMEAVFLPSDYLTGGATTNGTATESALTIDKLMQSIRDTGLVSRRTIRPRDYYLDRGMLMDHRFDAARYMMQSLGPMPRHMLTGFDLASGPDVTSVVEMKKPPPETSVRNK